MLKLVVFLSAVVAALASDVLELDDANFKTRVAEHDVALVEFFAPWCGHCKRLAPEYEIAATALKKNDPPVALAKVDCTESGKETCSKYGVSGYPTLKIFRGGEFAEEYNGPRESTGIIKLMKSKAGPSSKELLDVETTEAYLAGETATFVGFFSDDSSDIAKNFMKVADSMSEKYRFGHTTSADVMEKYGYKDDVVLFRPKRLFSKFEDQEVKYTDDSSVYKMKGWVKDNALGLCGHRSQDNADQFNNPLVVALYDVDYAKNPKGTNYWRNRVMKVAKKITDAGKTVNFAISSQQDFNAEAQEFGLTTGGEKPVVYARGAKGEKYVMSDEFSMDNLEKFVNDFLDGNLEQYLKSEDLPDNPEKGVQVAVAKNFDALVNNPDKDVLIEFYAPWCGHCKSLEPKYTELAEKLQDEEEITIAKMDATANDVPSPYDVRGFPTIYFAPKGSKDSPKKYEGGREVKDFIKYLAKESTNPLKGYDRSGKKKKSEL